jgi:hypothetical protein
MVVTRRPLFYGLCLLIGTLMFGGAGAVHPLLSGDGAAQLGTIARTQAWRLIHWSLLFGLAFMYAGLIGVSLRQNDTPGASPSRAGIRLGAFAFSVWSINVLLMVGTGYRLARAFHVADAGLTATHAVFIYDMLHPFGLAAERLATFLLGLVAYTFGWGIRNGAVWPRWLAWLAWLVAGLCSGVALVFSETLPYLYYAQAAFVVWLFLTAIIMLTERRLTPPLRAIANVSRPQRDEPVDAQARNAAARCGCPLDDVSTRRLHVLARRVSAPNGRRRTAPA